MIFERHTNVPDKPYLIFVFFPCSVCVSSSVKVVSRSVRGSCAVASRGECFIKSDT